MRIMNLKPIATTTSDFPSLRRKGGAYLFDTELYTLSVPDEEVRRDLCLLMTGLAANKDVIPI